MRVSDSIATGRVLLRAAPGYINNGGMGCAIGMAALAQGIQCEGMNAFEVLASWPNRDLEKIVDYLPCSHSAERVKLIFVIEHMFDQHVMIDKSMTLDQLIDWVRSIEPAEEVEQWEPLCQYTDDERRLLDLEHRCGVDDRD